MHYSEHATLQYELEVVDKTASRVRPVPVDFKIVLDEAGDINLFADGRSLGWFDSVATADGMIEFYPFNSNVSVVGASDG